jgi:ribosomal protein S18 acetylase RimI-like enzyme
MSDVLIRRARAGDAQTLAEYNIAMALETEHLRLDPHTVSKGVQAALADENKGVYFVAEIQSRIAAQLMVTHEWSDWRNGDIWWIQSVYVDPGYRRRGLFRQLYEHVKRAAKDAGAVVVRLYVERENEVAQRTYAQNGMHLTNYFVMEETL